MTGASASRGPRPGVRRPLVVLVSVAFALLIFAPALSSGIVHAVTNGRRPGVAHAVPAASAPLLAAVNLTDAPGFTPSSLTGGAGEAVSVHLTNVGRFNHTFTLEANATPLSAHWSPAQLAGFFAKNGSLVNVALGPGATGWANFTIPASDVGKSLEYVSTVAYQFQAGMVGYLNVSAGGPSFFLQDNATSSFAFVPNVLYVPATSYPVVVQVNVTNVGSLSHTWTLSPFPGYTLSPTNYSTFFTQHPPLGSANIPAVSGGTVTLNVTIPAEGVYDYICTVQGHFSNGMNGTLWVGIPPPAPAAPLSTALVQSTILALAGSLLLIAVLIAFASNYVGRFRTPSEPPHH